MAEGVQASADQHWYAGVVLLVIGLLVSVSSVRRRPPSARHRPAADHHLQTSVLVGLLTATALSGVGAGLVSTGQPTPGGWAPFAVAAALVLGPLVVSGLHRSRTSRAAETG